MTDISSIGHGSVGPAAGLHRNASPPLSDPNGPAAKRLGPDAADRVELSEHARYMNRLRELPDVRADRVEDLRRQIADGTYESEHKLAVAIARLLESFNN